MRADGGGSHTFPVSKSFKNISLVAAVTMGSRVLGLVRDMLVLAVFGASALASAFYTAFTLPNMFRRMLGEGALTAAFVPIMNEELRKQERAGAFRLVNQVSSWLLLVSGALVVVAMILLAQVGGMLEHAGDWGIKPSIARRWVAAAELAVVLFPYLVFVCLAAVFGAALQTLHRFLEPALSPVWLNLSMIGLLAGALHFGGSTTPQEQMLWLCAGALLGGFLQMAVPAFALTREGWRPRLDFSVNSPLRQILWLMGPTVFGSAIYLINLAVSRFLGLSLSDATVTLLNLASRLMELPIGVFAVAVTTVIFPLISKYAAAADWDNLASAYRKGMRLILVINVPAAAGLMILATPVIRLLFQRGEFTAQDTAATQPVLVVFALGLPFLSFVNIVLRAFYARKDMQTPVRAAVISFVVNVVLSLALMVPLRTVGLAIASNVAVAVQSIYLQVHLSRQQESLAFHHLGRDLVKVVVATLLMSAVVAGGWWARTALLPDTKAMDAVALVVLILGGAAIYGGVLWALRIEGRDDLAAMLLKARRKPV